MPREANVLTSRRPKRGRRRCARRDDGVTTVIGTLMVIALVTALLVNYQLRWVPVQVEEREATHMALVSGQLGTMMGVMDQQLQGTGNTTLSSPVAIGIPGRSFPWVPAISHQIELRSLDGAGPYRGVNVSSSRFTTVHADGTDLTSLSERWTPIAATSVLPDVVDVRGLRLHIAGLDLGDAGRTTAIVITDVNADPAGTFTLEVVAYDQNFTVATTVTNGTGVTIHADERTYLDGASFTDYFVDVLDEAYGFDELLVGAEGPLTLTFAESAGWGVEHAVTYVQEDGASRILQAAGGQRTWNYERELRSAQAIYTASNTQFVDQTYYVDNGALVVSQRDGKAFKVEPRLNVELTSDDLLVTFTLPTLRTDDRDLAGVSDISLRSTVLSRSSTEGWATDLTLYVVTAAPGAWATFFTETFVDAGVPDTFYTVTQGSNFASIDIIGEFASASVDDVYLALEHATIQLEVN